MQPTLYLYSASLYKHVEHFYKTGLDTHIYRRPILYKKLRHSYHRKEKKKQDLAYGFIQKPFTQQALLVFRKNLILYFCIVSFIS